MKAFLTSPLHRHGLCPKAYIPKNHYKAPSATSRTVTLFRPSRYLSRGSFLLASWHRGNNMIYPPASQTLPEIIKRIILFAIASPIYNASRTNITSHSTRCAHVDIGLVASATNDTTKRMICQIRIVMFSHAPRSPTENCSTNLNNYLLIQLAMKSVDSQSFKWSQVKCQDRQLAPLLSAPVCACPPKTYRPN